MTKIALVPGRIMCEWAAGDTFRPVHTALGVHAHYMAPLGFLVCSIGSSDCTVKLPEWVEGQVSDDS